MTERRLLGMLLALGACLALAVGLGRAEPGEALVLDMETAVPQVGTFGQNKAPAGTIAVVEGKVGKACRLAFAPDARSGFFQARVEATPEWDRAAGISFWVKGDGSQSWGGLELIDGSDYGARYGCCFPIDSTEWRKIVVPWRDLIPETSKAKPLDPRSGYKPSELANLWFGKWWYWGSYPAHSFTIDQVVLERAIPLDEDTHLPARAGLPRLREKLKAKQPVTIVTMGDSLSDKRHWANREVLWSEVVVERLGQTHGGEVRLVNPALGGTELVQNLVLMPRWLKETPQPDLVTICFGYNDWGSGMRGEHFAEMLRLGVDRVRRMTSGQAEVLLLTTCPALERWDTMEELAQAVRAVAAEKRTGLADIAAAFHRAGADGAARPALYCRDKTHLSPAGHRLAAETVLAALTAD